jgi:hypothetical protein
MKRSATVIALLTSICLATSGAAAAKRELPTSIAMFFSGIEALAKADERPDGISAEANLARIKPLMQQVVDAGAKSNRAELNALYPGWGDHFLDDAVAHARFILQALQTQDSDAMSRAMGTIIRWQQWWKPNQDKIMVLVADRYG